MEKDSFPVFGYNHYNEVENNQIFCVLKTNPK